MQNDGLDLCAKAIEFRRSEEFPRDAVVQKALSHTSLNQAQIIELLSGDIIRDVFESAISEVEAAIDECAAALVETT